MSIAKRFIGVWLILPVIIPAVAGAGEVLDPHKTILPVYVLPRAAAVDGDLAEWEGIPAVGSDKFKYATVAKAITPSAGFAPTLRCGRIPDSDDLYFLVIVRDAHVWSEADLGWLSGDFVELYLDLGRAKRIAADPNWYSEIKSRDLSEVGQFGFQPHTLRTPAKVRHAMNAGAWKVDYASVPVEGGMAYEIRLRTRSALDAVGMKDLPAVIGIDLGFGNEDYPVHLRAMDWQNRIGFYRLFGNTLNHIRVTGYGMLATRAVAVPKGVKLAGPPRTLPSIYGKSPTAAEVKGAIGKLGGWQLADLVHWAGLRGVKFDAPLVRSIMAAGSPRAQEMCLAVLAYTDQDERAVRAGVESMDKTLAKGTPQALTLVNFIGGRLGLPRRKSLIRLLSHEDPTVAITAARSLAAVGEPSDAGALKAPLQAACDRLDKRTKAGDKEARKLKNAYTVYFRQAHEVLTARGQRVAIPKSVAEREVLAENTDLPRHMPIDNNTVYNAAGLLRTWPQGGPKQLWRRQIGAGLTAVVEADGRALTVGKIDGNVMGWCFDAATGKELWRRELGGKGKKKAYPNVTPIVDGGRVYFVPRGVLCLDAKTGDEVWSEEKAYAGVDYSSPLIVGGVMYLVASRPAALVAIDKLTGKVLWEAAKGKRGTSASPAYQVIEGIGQIVCGVSGGGSDVRGFAADGGGQFWRWTFRGRFGVCASPVAAGSKVFLTTGLRPFFSECLQMYLDKGKIKAKLLYHRDDVQSNSHNTPAIQGGYVYGFGRGGLQCARLSDGALVWKQPWSVDRHLILADGLLIIATSKGELVLADATPDGYKERGRFATGIDLTKHTQQMTIANGRLYLRGKKYVVCYDLLKRP